MSKSQQYFVSVILPVYNAEQMLPDYLAAVHACLDERYENFEILVLDDRSTDRSCEVTDSFSRGHEGVRRIGLASHVGLEQVINAGFQEVIGDIAVVLVPGEDPLEALPEMIERVEKNQALVLGCLPESVFPAWELRLLRLFYKLCRLLSGVVIPERTTSFMGLTRTVLNTANRTRNPYRYLKTFSSRFGYDVSLYEYAPHPEAKRAGRLWSQLDMAVGMVVFNSIRPLRLVNLACLLLAGFYSLYALYIILIYAFKGEVAEGWVTLSMQNAVFFFVVSLVLFVLGEYIGRLLEETRHAPAYFVKDEVTSSTVVPGRDDRRNVVSDAQEQAGEITDDR